MCIYPTVLIVNNVGTNIWQDLQELQYKGWCASSLALFYLPQSLEVSHNGNADGRNIHTAKLSSPKRKNVAVAAIYIWVKISTKLRGKLFQLSEGYKVGLACIVHELSALDILRYKTSEFPCTGMLH